MINRRSVFVRLAAMCGLSIVSDSAAVASSKEHRSTNGWTKQRMAETLGRLSRLMPDDYVMAPRDPMTLAEDIHAHVNGQLDKWNIQLAACGTAALGCNQEVAARDSWAWSPAYQDTLDLRRKYEAAVRLIEERASFGQAIMLYPCGCSAVVSADSPGDNALPRYCPDHGDAEHTDRCHVIRAEKRARPTIAELEEILAQDGNGPAVTVLSNGQVIA